MSRFELKKWLKKSLHVVIVSISLVNGFAEVKSQANSLHLLKVAAESDIFNFPRGRYTVEYLPVSELDKDSEHEISLCRTIVAVAWSAKRVDDDMEIGCGSTLRQLIAKEDYFFIFNDGDEILSVVIKQPDNPDDLNNLITNLKKGRIAFFSVENGSGFMEENYIFGERQI